MGDWKSLEAALFLRGHLNFPPSGKPALHVLVRMCAARSLRMPTRLSGRAIVTRRKATCPLDAVKEARLGSSATSLLFGRATELRSS
jgi:hypothetical protein